MAGIVRLNSAAILREDKLYRKKQESEAAMLGAYERELRDSAEFDAWQQRMKEKDEDERLRNIEKNRMLTCAVCTELLWVLPRCPLPSPPTLPC